MNPDPSPQVESISERRLRELLEYLDGMRHDLRSPLHTIIGFSELLAEQREGSLNEKQMRFVRHIEEDSRRLLVLIDEVLDRGRR